MYIFRLSFIYFFTQNSVSNLVKRTILKIGITFMEHTIIVSNLVKRTILKICWDGNYDYDKSVT